MNHRGRVLGLCAAAGLGLRFVVPSPPPRTLDGLARLLGQAAGGSVRPTDIVWQPSPGVITEHLIGRPLLFLASARPDEPRDLYRARVRLSLDGRPIEVLGVRNLTSTPYGDDHALVARGTRAAFVTSAFGKVECISLLDLDRTDGFNLGSSAAAPFFERIMRAVTNVQETGSPGGIRRKDVLIDSPASDARLALSEDFVQAELDGRTLTIDPLNGTLTGDVTRLGAHWVDVPILPKRPILWAVDTIRAEVGPEPIAWLEQKVFAARDWVRRTRYALFGSADVATATDDDGTPPPTSDQPSNVLAIGQNSQPSGASEAGPNADNWPPPPVSLARKTSDRNEGQWRPVAYPWLKRLPAGDDGTAPPPYFYRTSIHPDPERPYAIVMIVAMDMRQLELDMEAGVEDPQPLTGPPGAGRISRDPAIIGRVVAAFNGAFKTVHGAYGMMVHRRVLLPPKPHAATIAVTQDGRVGLGTWGESADIPPNFVSFRQNLEPLVEDGQVAPSGRRRWGWQLDGTSMLTERSAICSNASGQLFYFWAEEATAQTLGQAMLQTGCTYGIHLDMNPHHTGFVFASVRDYDARDYDVRLLTPEMHIYAERYLAYSPKDFFYLMLRAPAQAAAGLSWSPDLGEQPPPAWMPAIYRALAVMSEAGAVGGASPAGQRSVQVELLRFEPGRVDFRLQPSAHERAARSARGENESHGGASRVLAVVGLGGLRDSKLAESRASDRDAFAALGVGADGTLRLDRDSVARPSGGGEAGGDLRLPLLVSEGAVLRGVRERGPMRLRGALGLASGGQVIVATATANNDGPLADALLAAGCDTAVGLDRGDHSEHGAPFLLRPQPGTSVPSRYDQAALILSSRPMSSGVFRWQAPRDQGQ
jgi:hypothetical protein